MQKRKQTSDELAEPLDVKRRKSDIGSIKIKMASNAKASSTPTITQHSLPSPNGSQPSTTTTFVPKEPSPLRQESPALQVRAPSFDPLPAQARKQSSPALTKKSTPASSRASPAASTISKASGSRASPALKAARKTKRVVLKFRSKKKEFAALVNGDSPSKANTSGAVVRHEDDDDDDDEDDAPLASRAPAVQRNGTPLVKAEMAPPPPPLTSIPTPNHQDTSERTDAPAPGKFKVKLKFGAGK